jgi:hypothetical protein
VQAHCALSPLKKAGKGALQRMENSAAPTRFALSRGATSSSIDPEIFALRFECRASRRSDRAKRFVGLDL